MKLKVSDRVYITETKGEEDKLDLLAQRFSHDNTLYWEARKHRRRCKHIPKKIILVGKNESGFFFPRGGLEEVLPTLKPEIVEDHTAFPRCDVGWFSGDVRDYQKKAVDFAINKRDGVIHAPTGSGKTVMGIILSSLLKTPTLFIVHTSVLLEQTAQKIRQFLGIEPGLLGGGKADIREITVAMVQTLMRYDLRTLRDRFGLVILDEAHHCPAETFRGVVQEFSARYRIGLTATPTRKDGLHPVLFDCVGPIIYSVSPDSLINSGAITPVQIVVVETQFYTKARKADYSELITKLTEDVSRNTLIVKTIIKHKGNRNLVLSERIAHCQLLGRMLHQHGLDVVVMTGNQPKEDRESAINRFIEGEINFLVSTTALVGEGFDLPAIDTVFLTVPNASPVKTAQALGRTLRPHEGKVNGKIVDFYDAMVPLLRSQYKKREKVYLSFTTKNHPSSK